MHKPNDNLQESEELMDYNLIMYIGTGLIIGGFLLFIYCEHKIRQADKELWRQEQLHKSFMRHKDASR